MITLTVATYNIHKGLSHFNQRMVLHELRERLRDLNADVLFLQEVQGGSLNDLRRRHEFPEQPQHEFLAERLWPHLAYGRNAVYAHGHHGNAILSRYPITHWDNLDVSAHRFESRGLLHCEIALPGAAHTLHCICVHFGLLKRWRGLQFSALAERVRQHVPAHAPLIIAGDFNDWRDHAQRLLAHELQVHEVFGASRGRLARSYPAGMPLFRMDRIYVRGLDIKDSEVHAWRKISDHAALCASLSLP